MGGWSGMSEMKWCEVEWGVKMREIITITHICPFFHHLGHGLLQTKLFGSSLADSLKLIKVGLQVEIDHLTQSRVLFGIEEIDRYGRKRNQTWDDNIISSLIYYMTATYYILTYWPQVLTESGLILNSTILDICSQWRSRIPLLQMHWIRGRFSLNSATFVFI